MRAYTQLLHSHGDDVLTANCPACAARVAVDQRMALIDDAPLRRCTWTCSYYTSEHDLYADDGDSLTFDLVVRVPHGWTGWDVDGEYGHLAGDAFILALPRTVALSQTGRALESMDVERVHIGPVVPEPASEPLATPSLFEAIS